MDLIDRQAAIDAIGEIHPLDYNAQAIAERIKELPSAHPLDPCETCLHKGKGWDEEPCDGCTGTESKYKPDNGWIPVSERLPIIENNIGARVLATTSWGLVNEAYYCVDHWEINDIQYELTSVTAWMPLPKPYGGDE